MQRGCVAVLAVLIVFPSLLSAQVGPSDPLRIAILVDNGDAARQPITQIRKALLDFIDALPAGHEVMLVTTGGSFRLRAQPTTDYKKAKDAANSIFSEGGTNTTLLAMLETYNRFIKNVTNRRPLFVLVTTDGAENVQGVTGPVLDKFLDGFLPKHGIIEVMALVTRGGSGTTEMGINLARQTGGQYDSANSATALPDKMKAIGARIAAQNTGPQ